MFDDRVYKRGALTLHALRLDRRRRARSSRCCARGSAPTARRRRRPRTSSPRRRGGGGAPRGERCCTPGSSCRDLPDLPRASIDAAAQPAAAAPARADRRAEHVALRSRDHGRVHGVGAPGHRHGTGARRAPLRAGRRSARRRGRPRSPDRRPSARPRAASTPRCSAVVAGAKSGASSPSGESRAGARQPLDVDADGRRIRAARRPPLPPFRPRSSR